MILSCQNICKSFGEKVILQDASFHIEDREKAALIGNNGAGKTTLLRIIMHELSPDSGNVVLAKDKNIGYLAQYQDIHGHHTIYEELISTKQHIIDMENRLRSLEQDMKTTTGDALDSLMNTYTRLSHQFELENGYAYKSEIMGVLKGLGFTEDDFHLRHPGGKLGSILRHVSDVMHTGDEMPLIKDNAIMQDALIVMSEKMLGCVGITNNNGDLIGIITDGDLRRWMSPDLITEKVSKVMTKNPKTIAPDALIAEAVNVMNNTGRGITNLFVVKGTKPVGVIHIHDCLKAGVS